MHVFIYAELGFDLTYAYQKPLPAKIKQHFPDAVCLDLDVYSEEFLVTQACRLVEQADVCGICFNSFDSEASIGALLRLAETIIRRQQESLVIVQGTHSRLERLFQQRAFLTFLLNPSVEQLWEKLINFYGRNNGRTDLPGTSTYLKE